MFEDLENMQTEITEQEHINQVAWQLIQDRGFMNVTPEIIAKEAGITLDEFNIYYGRMEDVGASLAHEHYREIGDKAIKLEFVYQRLCMFSVESIRFLTLGDREAVKNWIRGAVLVEGPSGMKMVSDFWIAISTLVEMGIEEGELVDDTPIERIANLLTAQYHGTLVSWCIAPDEIDPPSHMEQYCNLNMRILLGPYSAIS